MKKAIVTGFGGQDGYYIADYLLRQDYYVIGTVHNNTNSLDDRKNLRIQVLDIKNYNNVYSFIESEKPDEIYNFAAQSSSIYSWDKTRETCELNFMVPAAILESIRDNVPKCRFFQASSAEIFGKDPVDVPQVENTYNNPVTPYATAKSAAGMLIKNYREHYNIFAINGIFYNHESVRRKETFLPAKISRTVADIKLGIEECLYVGNVNSKRDWGYAPDYMEAAWRVMQLEHPGDYVFATGIFHTVKQMIEEAFLSVGIHITWEGTGLNEVGIDCESNRVVVRVDERFYRDYDRNDSIGNPKKLFQAINWKPQTSFEDMMHSMTLEFINKSKQKSTIKPN